MTNATSHLPALGEVCPLGARWCAWTVYVIAKGRHFTAEGRPAILRARRRRVRWRPVERVPVAWAIGPGEAMRLPDDQSVLHLRRHLHAWTAIGDRTLHVDWVSGTGGGQRFAFSLVRVYVDGALVDEQAHGGSSLGFTLWGAAAVASVGRRFAVSIERSQFSHDTPPLVWLIAPPPGRPYLRTEGGRSMEKRKVEVYFLKGDDVTAESLLAMYRAITGREPTPEEVAEVRREMEDREDPSQRGKDR